MDFLKQGLKIEPEQVKRWFGQYCSDNKTFDDFIESIPNEQALNYDELMSLASRSSLMQSPYSHFLFSKLEENAILFVNGEEYDVSQKLAEYICDDSEIDMKQLQNVITESDKRVVASLFNSGALIIYESK